MRPLFLSLLLTSGLAFALQAGLIENADFSAGTDRWSGPGTVVPINAAGNLAAEGDAVAYHALEVTLHRSDWTIVEQRFSVPGAPEKNREMRLSIDVQAIDFHPEEESTAYTVNDDLKSDEPNWNYRCPRCVFPKSEFIVRLSDESFHHAMRIIANGGAWKTVHCHFSLLKSKDRTLALLFPPGEGTVRVRAILEE